MAKAIKLHVASPCQADWEAMKGDEASRFCGDCKQQVYQLSNMSTEQVEELLESRRGLRTCVRFYQRSDGTMLTSDCSVGKAKKRKKRILSAVGAAAIGASAVGLSLGMDAGPSHSQPALDGQAPVHEQLMMGEPSVEEPAVDEPALVQKHPDEIEAIAIQGGISEELIPVLGDIAAPSIRPDEPRPTHEE